MRADLLGKSRSLARVLRHRPDLWRIKLGKAGWCAIEELLADAAAHGVPLTLDELVEIVETNDKARYTLSEDGQRTRAAQGHCVGVELGLKTKTPSAVLFHGTVERFLAAIEKVGLLPTQRSR